MQYNKKSVEDIDVSGKKVIARCDFNVPQDENGNITDDKRIRASLETINYLLDHNAAVILCSHLGRPKGEVNMKYSLAPVAKRLSELLGKEVKLAKDVVGEDAKKLAASRIFIYHISISSSIRVLTLSDTHSRIEIALA